MTISRLEKLPLRELWKHEAHGFTKWLAENLDFLCEATGIELSLVEREASAGPFSADILAEDSQGRPVVIENQLEQTDHDHLGKLITYMSNLDAKVAIWITSSPRAEHERAVHWLNETLPADTAFYLLQIQAFRIGNSDPAPHITVVAGPSPESKQVGEEKKELAERHILRMEFWKSLLEYAKGKTHLFDRISPGYDNWIGAGAGKGGMSYNFIVGMEAARVELYIDRNEIEENKRLFDAMHARKAEIEESFGAALVWERLDAKKACRIRFDIQDYGLLDKDHWPQLQEKLVDAMVRLHKALQPAIQSIS
jgi:hypothetical protein